MSLLEKIDELRARSVTDERFERVWGVTIEEYLERLMVWVEEAECP